MSDTNADSPNVDTSAITAADEAIVDKAFAEFEGSAQPAADETAGGDDAGQAPSGSAPSETPAASAPAEPTMAQVLEQQRAMMEEIRAIRAGAQPAQAAATATKPEPDEAEQRAAVLKEIQEELGLSEEDAQKHLKIMEKVAAAKAQPAISAAQRLEQERMAVEAARTEQAARTEAMKIVTANESVFGKADADFNTLPKSMQDARREWLESAEALRAGYAQMGKAISPERALQIAAAQFLSGTAEERVRGELRHAMDQSSKRRSIPPTAARNGVSSTETRRRGSLNVTAEDEAAVDKAFAKFGL